MGGHNFKSNLLSRISLGLTSIKFTKLPQRIEKIAHTALRVSMPDAV